jgi:hypothetical protein
MKYVVTTQYLENYGAHCEDGKYASNNHRWKFKGGTDYIVTGLNRVEDAVAFVQALCAKHGNNLGVKEFPRSWYTHEEWLTDVVGQLGDEEYRNFTLDSATHVDPRGQAAVDLLKDEAETTNPWSL